MNDQGSAVRDPRGVVTGCDVDREAYKASALVGVAPTAQRANLLDLSGVLLVVVVTVRGRCGRIHKHGASRRRWWLHKSTLVNLAQPDLGGGLERKRGTMPGNNIRTSLTVVTSFVRGLLMNINQSMTAEQSHTRRHHM